MKKKINTPFVLRLVSWLFPKVEKIAPWFAYRWFVSIFFTPIRYTVPYGEVDMLESAEKFSITYEGKKVQCYRWGEGKPILFVHGWMGRGTQFRKFIPVYNAAGYQVVSFDATGHGKSEGKRSHLMEFAGIISTLSERHGTFEMIVGHSLGGVAAMHAINNGLPTDKLIMISSPTLADKIVGEFLHRINASYKCKIYFEKYIVKTYGQTFEQYSASYVAKGLRPISLLLIHDENDNEVSMENPQAILDVYPSARLITTKGLGHTRILKDPKVIEISVRFLQRKNIMVEV